jgi:hypothetical protein
VLLKVGPDKPTASATLGVQPSPMHAKASVRVDLREAVLRGTQETQGEEQKPIEIALSRTSFLLMLPENSIKGSYQVKIVDPFANPLITGKATSSNGKILRITLDTRGLAEMRYHLCVSREGDAPYCYPIIVVNKR